MKYTNNKHIKLFDCNILGIEIDKNYNGVYEMTIVVDEVPDIPMSVIHTDGDTDYHYGMNDDGFVRYGVSHNVPYFGHDAGYMWSSRASVFNGAFGKHCIDVIIATRNTYNGSYTRRDCSITVPFAMSLLPDGYVIEEYTDKYNDGSCEIGYYINNPNDEGRHYCGGELTGVYDNQYDGDYFC